MCGLLLSGAAVAGAGPSLGGVAPSSPGGCGSAPTPVHDIQGAGAASPLTGQVVTTEGVVSAVRPGLSGFYLQARAVDADADPATSEGVFVFRPGSTPEVGSVVRVTGTVAEYAGGGSSQTELAGSPLVETCDETATALAATEARFPLGAPDELERVEGMLVTLPQALVVGEYFELDRYGQVEIGLPLPGQDRLYAPTSVVDPGPATEELSRVQRLRTIVVDDGRSAQNPDPVLFPGTVSTPFTLERRFRGGDTLSGVTGVLDETNGAYRVQPTADARYTTRNPRQGPPDVGGAVRVAGANLLNYFLTPDRTASTSTGECGPQRSADCRGADADQPQEFPRQRAKLVAELASLDADVVGLSELENTPGVDPAADLVAGLDAATAPGTWARVDTGVLGTDAIRVGLLYQKRVVRPVGRWALLDSTVDPRFIDTRNRPSLAQTFQVRRSGARFTLVVNHLKSKGSSCADLRDLDTGDGQGNCNRTRTLAAEALADWVAGDPTGSGDSDVLVVGDLNSYDHEDPVRALTGRGWIDLVRRSEGEYAYSYVFDGRAGYLDHALATPSMAGQVTGAGTWHTNADEPDLLDYDTTFKPAGQEALFAPDPYRSSDHDPVLVDLALRESCTARGAQTVGRYRPGAGAHGQAVRALGDPDGKAVSLGRRGRLAIRFARPVRNTNGAAPDLRLVDLPDGRRGRADAAIVRASADGRTWHRVGWVSRSGRLDLGDLRQARAVQVVDRSPRSSGDGYDLDAVQVLTGCSAR